MPSKIVFSAVGFTIVVVITVGLAIGLMPCKDGYRKVQHFKNFGAQLLEPCSKVCRAEKGLWDGL